MAGSKRAGARAARGDLTRASIVEHAATLYNRTGYAGLSISEVLAKTHLEKGGLYHHFKSKDELALAAFDYLMAKISGRIDAAMEAAGPGAGDRLVAMADVYNAIGERPFMPGGCPLLNTATESDDTHPALRARARAAMDRWHGLVRETIGAGTASGEFAASVDASAAATVVIAALEGGIMMSKLYHDASYVKSVATFVASYVTALRARRSDG